MIQPRRRPMGHPHQGLLPGYLRVVKAPFSPIIPVKSYCWSSFKWSLLQLRCQSMCGSNWEVLKVNCGAVRTKVYRQSARTNVRSSLTPEGQEATTSLVDLKENA